MCGRIANTLPTDAMAQLFAAAPNNDLPDVPNYNICPTDSVHTVTSDDGNRRLEPMRWGFIPTWYKRPNDGPLLINARAETIAEKPAFKAACRTRRCVVVATGFCTFNWLNCTISYGTDHLKQRDLNQLYKSPFKMYNFRTAAPFIPR